MLMDPQVRFLLRVLSLPVYEGPLSSILINLDQEGNGVKWWRISWDGRRRNKASIKCILMPSSNMIPWVWSFTVTFVRDKIILYHSQNRDFLPTQ